jgi:AraC-like DNA-binding protein
LHIAAFLPQDKIDVVQQFFDRTELFTARSWNELESRLNGSGAELALIDPAADGEMNLAAASTILAKYPSTPVVAYVTVTCDNLSAIAGLSRLGLAEVLVSPDSDEGDRVLKTVQRITGHRLAHALLAVVEARLGALEPRLFRAVQDLFERPHRYQTIDDLARESHCSRKCIHRAFKSAQLGTPRKFLTAARVVRGAAYLTDSKEPVQEVGKKSGYSRSRAFSKSFKEVFGSSPSVFRRVLGGPDVLEHVLEWLYKPPVHVLRKARS